MTSTNLDLTSPHQVAFIDPLSVRWRDVRRVQTHFYQRFHYEYPGPIRDLSQRLVVVPAEQYGPQKVTDHTLVIKPNPTKLRHRSDFFGNHIVDLHVPEADRIVSFEVTMTVETISRAQAMPAISLAKAKHYLAYTPLTTPDRRIKLVARHLMNKAASQHDLATRINHWVAERMRYMWGATTVKTTAAEALAIGEGLCQDYSHIMLAICRAAGLPARYVSGHLLGEGGSHAWVEVLLPTSNGLRAHAFDPTNNRVPHLGYITVAVGRDYSDVSPTSGSFSAPYSGCLTCSKRAALTLVEYLDGEMLRSRPA